MIRKLIICLGLLFSFALGAQVLVDPTKPKGAGLHNLEKDMGKDGTGSIKLTAVFIKSNNKIAVINGESVSEEQRWKGNQIKEIHKDGVVLVIDGRETKLLLNQYSIKKDASNDF